VLKALDIVGLSYLCKAAGMAVSSFKSEAMVLNWKKVVPCGRDESLPQVGEFKHLGILFISDGNLLCPIYWSVFAESQDLGRDQKNEVANTSD